MKDKKPVLRKCVVTNERLEKKDLIRVVRTPEHNVVIDITGKANGRGAYLKNTKEIILKAQKYKLLDKQLEITVPDSIYQELLKNANE